MIGIIDTLRGPARDDAAARDSFMAIMADEAERMKRLLADLLELSRLEAEEDTPPQGRADLPALARQVAGRLAPMATGLSVTLKVIEDAFVPQIQADPDQMTQVLTNLIENAVKYGSPPGATVTVSLALQAGPRGPMVRLVVADEGEGIDPRHIPRLTERFYRVDGHRSRAVGGTGLGLAIVKHIVGRHRGRLVIESAPHSGSQFQVYLPAGPSPAQTKGTLS
jgi:two-component system phosphate regulon sensor histidine kinase PhoR